MSIKRIKKIIAGLLVGGTLVGAPVIPQTTGYYIRTVAKEGGQFVKVDPNYNLKNLKKVEISGEACYNEFRYPDGNVEREKIDCVEYRKYSTIPNYPAPFREGAEWLGYSTVGFNTPSGDLEADQYAVEGTEKVSFGKMLTKKVEAAITFVNASSSVQQSSVSSLSWTYNNTASTDALFWLGVYMDENTDASRDITAASYNSIALTEEQLNDNTADNYRTEIWRLVAPATGNNTVSVTFVGALDRVNSVVMTFNGVDQSNPIGDKDGFTATNSQTATTTLTTTAVDSVLADMAVCSRTGSAFFAGDGQTARFTSSGFSSAQVGASTEPGGGSGSNIEMVWTCQTTAADWAQSAVEIKPAAAVAAAATANVHIKDADLIIKDGNLIIKD